MGLGWFLFIGMITTSIKRSGKVAISPNAGFCREMGKTQSEDLRFRHDFCWYGFNRQKGKALKIEAFGLKLGTPMVIKVSYETIFPTFPPLFLQSSWTLGSISPARYNQNPLTRYIEESTG